MKHWTRADLLKVRQRMGGGDSRVALRSMVPQGSTPAGNRPCKDDVVANSNPTVAVSRGGLATAPSSFAPYRSKLEYNWAKYLQGMLALGTITGFLYEPMNFRLPGQKNFYKPDFLTYGEDGVTFYEVKGWSMSNDRSLVKLKTAAGLNPWAKFVLVKRNKGQWEERHII